jgi:hypothetical protein
LIHRVLELLISHKEMQMSGTNGTNGVGALTRSSDT